jgi:hypothetical protein
VDLLGNHCETLCCCPFIPPRRAGTNVGVWDVEGDVDYNKLIEKFGCQPITPELRQRCVNAWIRTECIVSLCLAL